MERHFSRRIVAGMLGSFALGVMGIFAAPARADEISDFYASKTVEIYVGASAGGGYDIYARLIARHIGRHIPGNPNVVVKNMEGAGTVRFANWLYAVAPKDGTVFGTFARGVPLDPLFGNPGPQFTDGRDFTLIGSANDEVSVCAVLASAGATKFEDLQEKEIVVGGFGAATESEQHVKILNAVMGTKMRLVKGYPGGNDVNLAIERGEVEGRCGWSWTGVRATHQRQVDNGSLVVLVQNSLGKHADLPDIPTILEFTKSEEQAQMLRLVLAPQKMGRPFFGPPGLPAGRLTALQEAFQATMKDPEFLKDAETGRLEISPITAREMEEIIAEAYATPAELVQRTAEALR